MLDEIYVYEKDTTEIISIADSKGLDKHVRMWCDSAEPDRIKMWQRHGYRAEAVKKEAGSVPRTDRLSQRTHDSHTPALYQHHKRNTGVEVEEGQAERAVS